MDIINQTFTNSSYLKQLIDLTAKSWNVTTENEIKVDDPYIIGTDGFIYEKETGMLVPIQKIICNVKTNKYRITKIILIHNSEEMTLSCQAYQGNKAPVQYSYFVTADEENHEIKKYMDLFLH